MESLVLDTSVASLILIPSRQPESLIRARYKALTQGRRLVVSFQTIAELLVWPERNQWGDQKREQLHSFLDQLILVSYSYELALTWAKLTADCRSKGRRLEAGDAWVAATALFYQLPLATHDRDHMNLDIPGLDIISYLD